MPPQDALAPAAAPGAACRLGVGGGDPPAARDTRPSIAGQSPLLQTRDVRAGPSGVLPARQRW